MKIKFLKTNQEIECNEKQISLLEVCYRLDSPVNFGCRIGMCGTCTVSIVKGIKNVSKKTEDEEMMTHEPNDRLGCQCIIKGDVEIE